MLRSAARSWLTAALVLTGAQGAFAAPAGFTAPASERVAVLPFVASGGGTTSGELEAARGATRDAVVRTKATLPSDAEEASAEHGVKDGVADTSAEYQAAGRAAGAQWTVAGHVDVHGATYRLELDACQTATGRVESLAREIEPKQAPAQIAEMLALLLRAQGVGDAVPPWDQPSAATPVPAPAPTPVVVTPPPPPPVPETPPAPAVPPPAYAEGHPSALGLGGEVLTAFSRASNARGSATAGLLAAKGAYALAGAPGLEIVANAAVAVGGPKSLWLDAGVRYALPLAPRARLFLAPEVTVGAFFDLGGDKDARFLARAELPLVLGLGERVEVEAYPEIAYAAGGTAGLGFAGGGLRAVLRF